MEQQDKTEVIQSIFECINEAMDIESDGSDTENLLTGLVGLCEKVAAIPTKRKRREWVKVWREKKSERGSFAFLTKELAISDKNNYRNYVRMTEEQFNSILFYIRDDIEKKDTIMRTAISPAEKLALTLRFLATGETFQSLNFDSKVSKASICKIIPEVCDAIWKRLKGLYMKFPSTSTEWESIAKEFAIKWQFPNCIGALDGKHISFRSPRKDGAFYHNYKGTNSIVLLALVDACCKFIFIDVGCNGRNNDAGVFLQSELSQILQEERGLPKNSIVGKNRSLPYVIVGDDAFPMQTHLMKPYPYHSNSTEKQYFNKRLSRARHVAEHSFGMVSNRFRVLLAPISLKVDTVQSITLACCVLHNFLTENNIQTNFRVSENRNRAANDLTYNPRRGGSEAIRQEFTAYFNNEGKLDW